MAGVAQLAVRQAYTLQALDGGAIKVRILAPAPREEEKVAAVA